MKIKFEMSGTWSFLFVLNLNIPFYWLTSCCWGIFGESSYQNTAVWEQTDEAMQYQWITIYCIRINPHSQVSKKIKAHYWWTQSLSHKSSSLSSHYFVMLFSDQGLKLLFLYHRLVSLHQHTPNLILSKYKCFQWLQEKNNTKWLRFSLFPPVRCQCNGKRKCKLHKFHWTVWMCRTFMI